MASGDGPRSLVWISGSTGGIGAALKQAVPWTGARVIGIGRRAAGDGDLRLDLTDPSTWSQVGESFRRELSGFSGDRVVFVQAAGTLDPMGFAGEVDSDSYARNVLLNSAAPQVLGHLFLAAVSQAVATRQLVMITSGAARTVYPGWSSYGAAKAAVDQWVRTAGAEQDRRGGAQVIAVAPGRVDTGMQRQLRESSESDFPQRQTFVETYEAGKLVDPADVAAGIWSLLDRGVDNGSVVNLPELLAARA